MFLKKFVAASRLGSKDCCMSVLNALAGIILVTIAVVFQFSSEDRQFDCQYPKTNQSDKDRCLKDYDELYNKPLTIFVAGHFFSPTFVTLAYSFLIKTHVNLVEESCKFDEEDPRRTKTINTKYIFYCYSVQLIIRQAIRFVISYLFVLYAGNSYPSEFSCQYNSTSVTCVNSLGAAKTNLSLVVKYWNIVFMGYIIFELLYLFGAASSKPGLKYDTEFCHEYLKTKRVKNPRFNRSRLNQKCNKEQIDQIKETEFLERLLPMDQDNIRNKLSDDDIFTDVHIVDIHSKKNGTAGVRLNDIFRGNPRTILIMGENVIGKSFLSAKLLRDWLKGQLYCEQEFQYVFLFSVRHLHLKSMAKVSFKDFLGKAEHSIGQLNKDTLRNILENAEKVLFIFDGLDEFKDLDKCIKCESDYAGFNGVNDKIPVSALFVKLLQNKLLRGATIIATTVRPSAIDSADWLLNKFDKVLEIVGFQTEAVKIYVYRFFKGRSPDHKRIWEQIILNPIITELCKIPALFLVVLNWFAMDGFERASSTLTEIFQKILVAFILKHHPELEIYEGSEFFTQKAQIEELRSYAKKALEDNRREVFEQQELKNGLKKSCLMVCLPKLNDVLPYGRHIDQPQYRFAFPYLQEFLAARCIVSEAHKDRLEDDIRSKAEDEKWHVVLQFVAGLISDMKCKSDEWKEIYDKLVGTFNSILQSCLTKFDKLSMQIALNTMKCIHELNVEEDKTRAALQLFVKQIDFTNLGVSPADCFVMADFLHRLREPLDLLNLESNDTILESGLSELSRLVGTERSPRTLNISNCNVTDEGLKVLMEATCKNGSTLDSLLISGNTRISRNGIEAVCKALKDDSCQIKELDLYGIRLCKDGAQYICEALQDSTCRLSELYVNLDVLFESLRKENPKTATDLNSFAHHQLFKALIHNEGTSSTLKVLGLRDNKITDDGVRLLCEILKDEKCQLKKLYLTRNLFSDKGLEELNKSKQDGKGKLQELNV